MILLDTHIWVWWVQGDRRLSQAVLHALDEMPAKAIAVSAISFWEIALLARRGRLTLPDAPEAWLRNVSQDPRLNVLPVTADVAARSALLPDVHKDPADRMIIAQAIIGGYALVSEDRRILSYEQVRVLRPDMLLDKKVIS